MIKQIDWIGTTWVSENSYSIFDSIANQPSVASY